MTNGITYHGAFFSLQKMLLYEPSTRLSAKQALQHNYFRDVDPLIHYVAPKLANLQPKAK